MYQGNRNKPPSLNYTLAPPNLPLAVSLDHCPQNPSIYPCFFYTLMLRSIKNKDLKPIDGVSQDLSLTGGFGV